MAPDMSLLSLIGNASFLVKMVMLVLVAASVVSWTLIFQRGKFLRDSSKSADDFEDAFWAGTDLSKLYNKLSTRNKRLEGLKSIFAAGYKEFSRLHKLQVKDPDLCIEAVQRAMRIKMTKEEERLEKNLSLLATIQSMSPYIGLFGTVWGIMHSFRALGAVQQASLAMVAPGISEALIATAMGLIAAIPAGIAYNRYIARVDQLSTKYQMFVEEFIAILQRRMVVGEE